jgi:protein-L-isoaspartate(D-aspartate) O-methyltransferase
MLSHNLEQARATMVERQLRQRGLRDPAVLAAMQSVPRDAFVPDTERDHAYADNALPLGHGQTISQPYMVARALELAKLLPGDRALEVGLGSGYQAAVMSRLCGRVIGIELVPELAQSAERTLRRLGFDNIEVITGDGSVGYSPAEPYDAIVVAAGAPRVPQQLVDQLRIGGRLVIPVGEEHLQTLTVITRTDSGVRTELHDTCIYVPLRGAAGRN